MSPGFVLFQGRQILFREGICIAAQELLVDLVEPALASFPVPQEILVGAQETSKHLLFADAVVKRLAPRSNFTAVPGASKVVAVVAPYLAGAIFRTRDEATDYNLTLYGVTFVQSR